MFDNLPEEFKRKAIKVIAAFEIQVTKLDTIFKLSQDRDARSYVSIIDHLNKQGEHGHLIAGEMRKRANQLFSKTPKGSSTTEPADREPLDFYLPLRQVADSGQAHRSCVPKNSGADHHYPTYG